MSNKKMRRKRRGNKNLKIITEIKENGRCKICGKKNIVLQFHHRRQSLKSSTVVKVARRYGVNKMFEEIDKCDLLCEPCHRRVHKLFKKIDDLKLKGVFRRVTIEKIKIVFYSLRRYSEWISK